MTYYSVFPASHGYKSNTPLVYSSELSLPFGQLVIISLRGKRIAGIVTDKANKPHFKVKDIDVVYELPPLPAQLISLAVWLARYYACGLGPAVCQIVSLSYLKSVTKEQVHVIKHAQKKLPSLTEDQKLALKNIAKTGTSLLHGETGSGKTRVYIEITKKVLKNQQSVVILTPEIGLTTQLYNSFHDQFGDQIMVVHSGLTPAKRRNAWQTVISSDHPLVVIGPRSALFSPLKNIGLVVIDEAHDSAYKQNSSPHYQSSTVAAKLSEQHKCPLILGTATPSINDYFLAKQRKRPIIHMTHPATQSASHKPELKLIDIKNRTNFKHAKYLSDDLIRVAKNALNNKEQVLLFLNRRGTSRSLLCLDCGWIALCPNCGLPLTYHKDKHALRCHICGYKQTPPSNCLVCQSVNLQYKGVGSKAVEEEARKLFPKARVQRFDSDNPKVERLDQVYNQIKNSDTDIIIGTQTIAKGLDLPNLSVVGVIVADTSLNMPDYLADERTFQMIRQVVGRIGRGHIAGKAIVQTYSPSNSIIRASISGNYRDFYDEEIKQRRLFGFPPTKYLLKVEIARASAKSAERKANTVKQRLANTSLGIEISDPSPCFHELRNKQHHWQIIIKSSTRLPLLKAVDSLPSDCTYELDPLSLL